MRSFLISVLFSGSCLLGCCSVNKSQEGQPVTGTSFDTTQGTVQRYEVIKVSTILESVDILDSVMYKLHARTVSTAAQGQESIADGQLIELLPRYIYDTQNRIDWSIAINKRLRALRDSHPGSPINGTMMLNQRQEWLLINVE